jgi:hypothetical protein
MGLPTPINWLRSGLETPDHLLVQFTIIPKDKTYYPAFRSVVDCNDDDICGQMPGPVQYMVAGPTGNSEEEFKMVLGTIVNETLNSLLAMLQEKFKEIVEEKEMEVATEFTVNNMMEDENYKKILQNNSDIFGGVQVTDSDGDALFEIYFSQFIWRAKTKEYQ